MKDLIIQIKNEDKNTIKLRNSKSSVNIINKLNTTTLQPKENIIKELDDKNKLLSHHSYTNLNKKQLKIVPKVKDKIKNFESKKIASKLRNKYLNKGIYKLKKRNNN